MSVNRQDLSSKSLWIEGDVTDTSTLVEYTLRNFIEDDSSIFSMFDPFTEIKFEMERHSVT